MVSIGLAVYNGETFLVEALDSLINQSYENLEILIGDNASSDGTREICLRYAEADPRVRYLRSEVNQGAAWNFNRLAHEARGRYLRWAAADDLVGPEVVEKSIAILEAQPDVVLVYPRTRLIDQDGREVEEYDDRVHLDEDRPSERFWLLQRRLHLCNAFYGVIRLESLRRTGLLPAYPYSDNVLMAELALHGKFHELPGHYFYRRFHQAAASQKDEGSLQAHYEGTETPEVDPPENHLRHWRYLAGITSATIRAPIPSREKARTFWYILRRAWWSRYDLAGQMYHAPRYWVRLLRHRVRNLRGQSRERRFS